MEIVKRSLQPIIESWLFRNKIVVLYGARQVGKTTIVKEILKGRESESVYYNCEVFSVSQALQTTDPNKLLSYFGKAKLIVFDEAQKIENIGLILKIIHDNITGIQIIATGSSSFTLSDRTSEPLTGRSVEFILYPFSIEELHLDIPSIDLNSKIFSYYRYGLYPEIIGQNDKEAQLLLDNLAGKYLYKDVLEFEQVKKPQFLVKLLQLLAFQVGSEVSLNELAVNLQITRGTVERYLDLLEKAFVIFRLHSLSRNLRSELTKKMKIYFYDVGIRNSLISNFNPVELRNDTGALWENFCIVERLKYLQKRGLRPNRYFWRTHAQQEIDYIEESGGVLSAFEFKFKPKGNFRGPKEFQQAYSNSSFKIIHPDNLEEFLT